MEVVVVCFLHLLSR